MAQMSVKAVLDALIDGRLSIQAACDNFRNRAWPTLPRQSDAAAYGVEDDEPAPADSWADVNADSRLSTQQYTALARAYGQGTGQG